MTPFGERVRKLRRERGLLLKDMAAHLGVSSAYLSALERGERGKPTWTLIQGVMHYFNIIWDEADELARLADLSDPRVKIDTASTSPRATLLANRLAREIRSLDEAELEAMIAILDEVQARTRRPIEALVMETMADALAAEPPKPKGVPARVDRA
jgi:transcriptional regulator with XRE-family HTH domain